MRRVPLIESAKAERDLKPLVLFRGNMSLGRAQGLWNFTGAMRDAQIADLTDITRLAAADPELRHWCGVHGNVSRNTLAMFWSRIWSAPAVWDIDPTLVDYTEWVVESSRSRVWIFQLDPISEYSVWSKRKWRRRGSPSRKPGVPREPAPEIPTVWPFALNDDHIDDEGLLILVDRVVPKSLPEQIRQDVCQDLILGVLSGEVDVRSLATEAGTYTKKVFRDFPIKYGPLSLDAPAPWGDPDGRTLGETLSAEDGLWTA